MVNNGRAHCYVLILQKLSKSVLGNQGSHGSATKDTYKRGVPELFQCMSVSEARETILRTINSSVSFTLIIALKIKYSLYFR